MNKNSLSLADQTETILCKAILSGALEPGSRLAIPKLSSAYGIGVTPLREGLSRLAARGLVTIVENKGFRVAEISREDLLDITESRVLVEKAALVRAFENPDPSWEDGVVAAMHKLSRVIRSSAGSVLEGSAEFDLAHKEFHVAIVTGCGLRRFLAVQSELYDAAYRYRRIMNASNVPIEHVYDVHKRLADLVLARDPRALTELEQHLFTTIGVVYGPNNN